jgi:serine/threonine protein kinase
LANGKKKSVIQKVEFVALKKARRLHAAILEAKLHERLSRTNNIHFLTLYGYVRRQDMSVPLGVVPVSGDAIYTYMEHARWGDVSQYLALHKARNKENFEKESGHARQVPEFLIWVVCRAVVEALFTMKTGKVPPAPLMGREPNSLYLDHSLQPEEGWHAIVHRDMKPGNIVLTEPDELFPHHPVTKLIDFGLAFQEDVPEDPRNSVETYYGRQLGTAGYMAPVCDSKGTTLSTKLMQQSGDPVVV